MVGSLVSTACILKAVDTLSYVVTQMDSTSSLMGRQTAAWDGLEASWTYHPDNGLDVQIVEK